MSLNNKLFRTTYTSRLCDDCLRPLAYKHIRVGDDDAVAEEIRQAEPKGCPAPKDAALRWFKCAQCPEADFCAPCSVNHAHPCELGLCHHPSAVCPRCSEYGYEYGGQDEQEDSDAFVMYFSMAAEAAEES
jgi:hypothetical protein